MRKLSKEKILARLNELIKIANELEAAGVILPSDARELRVVSRVVRDDVTFKDE